MLQAPVARIMPFCQDNFKAEGANAELCGDRLCMTKLLYNVEIVDLLLMKYDLL